MTGRNKKKLDPRKSIFISEILTGKNGAEAARAAGIEKRNAARQANRWQKEPEVAEEIEKGLAAIRAGAAVTCESMIKQLDADRLFAIKTENASAATRASELKAKLCGLMIDRRDVRAAHIVKAEDYSTRDVALAINALIQDSDLTVVKRNSDAPDADEFETWASPDDLEQFATTQEGSELVSEWGSSADHRLGVIQARLLRMEDTADMSSAWAWFDALPSAQAKAVLRELAR